LLNAIRNLEKVS